MQVSNGVDRGQVEAEVERILRSKEFSSSRQLHQFLRFVTQRALDGCTHLEQTEIAAAVLGKLADFDPLNDASVRKLATVTRQRLDHYYANEGRADPVLITLPMRFYLPHFRERDSLPLPPPAALEERAVVALPRRRWPSILGLICGVALLGTGGVALRLSGTPDLELGTFVFRTLRGDFYGQNLDVPGEAVRLGPPLGAQEEVSVRMRFIPEMDAHQAGLLLWSDADHYIKLGRRFTGRNFIEFAIEHDMVYRPAEGTLQHDPDGQSGEPVWLNLRRSGRLVAGYTSRDGVVWSAAGRPVEASFDLDRARLGLYALNGRRTATPTQVVFDHLGIGSTFALGESGAGRWVVQCADSVSHDYRPPVLQFRFLETQASCSQDLMLPAPQGDWSYRTQLDYQPVPGSSAGLVLRGEKGAIRLVRYLATEPTVAMIQVGRDIASVRDFPGSPPLVLRLSSQGGVVTGSFSRDDRMFHALPRRVRLDQLGVKLEIGISHFTSPFGGTQPVPASEFYYLRREIGHLEDFRRYEDFRPRRYPERAPVPEAPVARR